MQTHDVFVRGRCVFVSSSHAVVRTSAGVDEARVLFDDAEWGEFPVTVTLRQGSEMVTMSMSLEQISDNDWSYESTFDIPREVTQGTTPIYVTFQGTDQEGRHIITSKGGFIRVVDSGDIDAGEVPDDAPTEDQYNHAYSLALEAAGRANAAADAIEGAESRLSGRIDSLFSEYVAGLPEQELPIATKNDVGVIKVGDGLFVDVDGTLSASQAEGMTTEQANALINLSMLAYYGFDTEFESTGLLKDNVKVKRSVLPIATVTNVGAVMPDGVSIVIGEGGIIRSVPCIRAVNVSVDDSEGTPSGSATVEATANTMTLDFAFSGLKGDSYVLTEQDKQDIAAIVADMLQGE